MTGKQRRYLRALAHGLQPVVTLGRRGVTEALAREVGLALEAHELIKVRVARECPVERDECGRRLAAATGCEVAGAVGRVLILYRPRPADPGIVLPAGGRARGGPPDAAGPAS